MKSFFNNNQLVSINSDDNPIIVQSDFSELSEDDGPFFLCRMDGYTILPTEKYEELLQNKAS